MLTPLSGTGIRIVTHCQHTLYQTVTNLFFFGVCVCVRNRILHSYPLETRGFQTCMYIYIYIYKSLMSCHLLLNLLHELGNMILCEALPSIISFLTRNLRFYLLHNCENYRNIDFSVINKDPIVLFH